MKLADAETFCEDIRLGIAEFDVDNERNTYTFGGPTADARMTLIALTQLIAVARAADVMRASVLTGEATIAYDAARTAMEAAREDAR